MLHIYRLYNVNLIYFSCLLFVLIHLLILFFERPSDGPFFIIVLKQKPLKHKEGFHN